MKTFLPTSVAALALTACGGREVEVVSSTTATPPASPTRTVAPSVPARLDGAVSALTGTCPSITFTVAHTTVSASSATNVDGGCTAIVNGANVSVTGTRQADDSVAATRVAVRESQVDGAMSGVKGSCPVLNFSVGTTAIWMDTTTVLNGLSCGQLVNGTLVRVDGFLRADGSIMASAISAGRR